MVGININQNNYLLTQKNKFYWNKLPNELISVVFDLKNKFGIIGEIIKIFI